MAIIANTAPVNGPIAPIDSEDVYPTHFAKYGKGGFYTVSTLAERNAIPLERREAGLTVLVTNDSTPSNNKSYTLDSGLANSDWHQVLVDVDTLDYRFELFKTTSIHYMGELLFAIRNSAPPGFIRFTPGWEGLKSTYADFYAECSDFLEVGSTSDKFKLPSTWGGRVIAVSPDTGIHTIGSESTDATTSSVSAGTPSIHGAGAGTPSIHGASAGTPNIHGAGAGTPSIHGASAGTPSIHGGGSHSHESPLSSALNSTPGGPGAGEGSIINGADGTVTTDTEPNHTHGADVLPEHNHGADALPVHNHGVDALPEHNHGVDALPEHNHGVDALPEHNHTLNVSVIQPTVQVPTFIYVGVFS